MAMPFGIEHYILNDDESVTMVSLDEFLAWMETHERRIAWTVVNDITVSTIFLGLDHGYGRILGYDTPPILFETMIFGGECDEWQERYATKADAIIGHQAAVDRCIAQERFRTDEVHVENIDRPTEWMMERYRKEREEALDVVEALRASDAPDNGASDE
jgi:hypothetical protein